jgi:putative hydroxymethylpyrimidine transport system ATP-binding protein
MSASITIRDAYLAYNQEPLFNQLNLTINAGKWTTILGPSGIGKSTLLRMIAGLVAPHVNFQGEIINNTQQIAYMAQTDLLMPWFSVLDNVLLSKRLQKKPTSEDIEKAKALLTQMGLEKAIDKLPHELSGGMRQRVALARTLFQDKPVILMDEPFSAVDAVTRFQLQAITAKLLKNRTVLLVTHDPMEALRLSDEIYILAGQPATLSSVIQLSSCSPRDPADPELIKYQADLFHQLIQAKEMSA